MDDDIDFYTLYQMAKQASTYRTRPLSGNTLKVDLPKRFTWPMHLTQDDRDFLKQIQVKADA